MTFSEVDLDRELVAKGGLRRFTQLAWPIVETTPLVWGKHMDIMCEELEKVQRCETKDLVINLPPGMSKSLMTSVFFPCWAWTIEPDARWCFASHSADLSRRDNLKAKELLDSDWYRERWGDIVQLDRSGDKADTAGLYYNTATGFRMATSVGSRGIGWHFHYEMCDDVLKPIDAVSPDSAALEGIATWWKSTMASRKADPDRFRRVIVMQRIHELDLAGVCISDGGYKHVCLPMEYSSSHPYKYEHDTREEGELLCPERFPREAVDQMRRDMGPQVAAAQLDQLPTPPGGGVFKTDWLSRRWTELPDRGAVWVQSWDHTFGSKKKGASYVVGQIWCHHMGNSYLVHQVRDQMEFPEMIASMEALTAMFPQAMTKLVEAKAAGALIEQQLRVGYRDERGKLHRISGIQMIKADRTTGGKLARAQSTTGLWQAGNVLLPATNGAKLPNGKSWPCPWVEDLVKRFLRFKGADADVADEIDAASQALVQCHGTGAARFARTMMAARANRRAS